jgi:cation:H+ antiporter
VLSVGVIIASAVSFNYPRIIPMIMFLVFTTVAFVIMARSSSELTNNNGKVLLLLYIGFIVWMRMGYI